MSKKVALICLAATHLILLPGVLVWLRLAGGVDAVSSKTGRLIPWVLLAAQLQSAAILWGLTVGSLLRTTAFWWLAFGLRSRQAIRIVSLVEGCRLFRRPLPVMGRSGGQVRERSGLVRDPE